MPEGVHSGFGNPQLDEQWLQNAVADVVAVDRFPGTGFKEPPRLPVSDVFPQQFDQRLVDVDFPKTRIALRGLLDPAPHRPSDVNDAVLEVEMVDIQAARLSTPDTRSQEESEQDTVASSRSREDRPQLFIVEIPLLRPPCFAEVKRPCEPGLPADDELQHADNV